MNGVDGMICWKEFANFIVPSTNGRLKKRSRIIGQLFLHPAAFYNFFVQRMVFLYIFRATRPRYPQQEYFKAGPT